MTLTRRTAAGLLAALAALLAACSSGGISTGGTTDSAAQTSSGVPSESSAVPTSSTPASNGSLAPQALHADAARGPSGSPQAAREALGAFGVKVLQQLPGTGNATLSPYSIYEVLAMARAGAKGETARQLDAVLGGDSTAQGAVLTAVDAAVAKAVAAGAPPPNADPKTVDTRMLRFDGANAVWTAPDLAVHPEYLNALAKGFGVGMYQLNFAADPEEARRIINSWVSEHTAALIKDLIPKGVIDQDTVMTLVNALHLSAPWAKEFVAAGQPSAFTTLAGKKVTVPAMTVTQNMVHASGKGWTSVTVPYKGNGLAMTLIVPDVGSFAAVRSSLLAVLSQSTSATASEPVMLSVPKFSLNTHTSMKATLKTLGVSDIFDSSKADLSGIAGQPGYLYAGDVVHQAVVTVDEKGTEAAAATAMTMEATSAMAQALTVTVDRPFFFAIHDTVTGAPLFLGQVADPTA